MTTYTHSNRSYRDIANIVMTSNKRDIIRALRGHKPIRIIGLVRIKDEDYTLVLWSDQKKYYVPYSYIKKNYPDLLIDLFQRGCETVSLDD